MNDFFFGPIGYIFSCLPPIVKIIIGIIFAVLSLILIFKIIKLILDAIPFV